LECGSVACLSCKVGLSLPTPERSEGPTRSGGSSDPWFRFNLNTHHRDEQTSITAHIHSPLNQTLVAPASLPAPSRSATSRAPFHNLSREDHSATTFPRVPHPRFVRVVLSCLLPKGPIVILRSDCLPIAAIGRRDEGSQPVRLASPSSERTREPPPFCEVGSWA
jgi:hypothetical protein